MGLEMNVHVYVVVAYVEKTIKCLYFCKLNVICIEVYIKLDMKHLNLIFTGHIMQAL